ncbi:YcaO-like family protein [Actinacidiphila sp. ITFR-21]|uniref:YcaO-like family protein n=1 Tax=Actinacidiphila sp. ITFR-21 TaxID=3075199 RepID=UPI00288AACCE|nr:YcaO-like family protein [Streptomyces sp. ITFR-21]WNI16173.1 YcaO-like family protein [Streptomyces sp. ITFR-21]
MIDVPATLDPAAGIARTAAVAPPEPPRELLWRTVVVLGTGPAGLAQGSGALPTSDRVVGACGHSRADSLLRGAGEAVERAALHPGLGALPGARRARLPDAYARLVALADPDGADDPYTWYPAQRLRDGTPAWVPAPLVDWPPRPDEGAERFDPGPSGAASGDGLPMALLHALLEVVERDAVMTAWQRGLDLPRIGLPQPGPRSPRALREAVRLRAAAQAAGTRTVLARVPVGVPGVFCCAAIALDDDGRTAAVGCTASAVPARAVLGALQEALQVGSLLRGARRQRAAGDDRWEPEPGATIRGEEDRIAFLLTSGAVDLVRDWTEGFTEAVPLPGYDDGAGGQAFGPGGPFGPGAQPLGPRDTAALTAADVVAALVKEGADPLAVDLTPRLPPKLRAMGWAAVKVVPVGCQGLRMSEEPAWSRNLARLGSAERRTGLSARHAPDADRPHPLP